ncbi:hypothetical protein E2562_025529 [Oryza meyeriana var. granulata]|uniref:DUF834 domain-containing protein n=1 Tax=Oryza meyeriana var. granulata TaxID=110450 RepID=A0A6G1FC94_9ORYZ|nr:hypothetical protein E2562_025529 [Oryza meyeriana var. granulata]
MEASMGLVAGSHNHNELVVIWRESGGGSAGGRRMGGAVAEVRVEHVLPLLVASGTGKEACGERGQHDSQVQPAVDD